MSPRKIIFLIVIGLVGILMVYGIWNLSQSRQNEESKKPTTLTLWVVGDTSEQYQTLFGDFIRSNELFSKTNLEVLVFPSYEKYQKILLSTLAEGKGPDIFMVEGGGDDILASKGTPIPDSLIDLRDFEKKYEDIFLPLLIKEGEGKDLKQYIRGVPLGYETLGMFYHKSLLREIPRTWSEIESPFTGNDGMTVFPTNLGLGPTYVPYVTDILSYFLGKNQVRQNTDLMGGAQGIDEYFAFAQSGQRDESITSSEETLTSTEGLIDMKSFMDESLLSTIDLFMRGRIAMIIGYQSLIHEIEKSGKRAGEEILDDLILTEKIPQDSLGQPRVNIARYKYLALSTKSQNALMAANLLSYIMSDAGALKTQEVFPLLISPVRSSSAGQKDTPLSKVFARTRLDAFIPDLQDDVFVFDYGNKTTYDTLYRDFIDRKEKIDINKLLNTINTNVECELLSSISGVLDEKCLGNAPL